MEDEGDDLPAIKPDDAEQEWLAFEEDDIGPAILRSGQYAHAAPMMVNKKHGPQPPPIPAFDVLVPPNVVDRLGDLVGQIQALQEEEASAPAIVVDIQGIRHHNAEAGREDYQETSVDTVAPVAHRGMRRGACLNEPAHETFDELRAIHRTARTSRNLPLELGETFENSRADLKRLTGGQLPGSCSDRDAGRGERKSIVG